METLSVFCFSERHYKQANGQRRRNRVDLSAQERFGILISISVKNNLFIVGPLLIPLLALFLLLENWSTSSSAASI